MTSSIRTSWQVWRAPRARTTGDRAYLLYMAVLLTLVTIAPMARGIWMLVTDPLVAARLLPAAASRDAVLLVAAVWASAVVAGQFRGPVIFAPVLASAFSVSAIPRRIAYARPFWRAATSLTLIGMSFAAMIAAGWMVQGAATPVGAACVVVVGAACGIIAAVLWLLGQLVSARVAGIVVVLLLGMAGLALLAPATTMLTPLGWVMLSYSSAGASGWWAALVACATISATCVPWMLGCMHAESVVVQSLRWDSARTHAGLLDLSASAATYQPLPRVGRRVFAVRVARGLAGRMLIRDSIAASRTPARLAAGVAGLLVAGALLTLVAATPSVALAAIVGVVTFLAIGPFTDGLRHIVESAAAVPLYGASDLALVASHAIFPLLAGLVLLVLGSVAVAVWLPGALGGSLAASIVLALASVSARLMGALKPPMPVTLLMPMPTPMGDVATLARAAWAIDGVLLAGFAGVAAATVVSAPWMSVVTLAVGWTIVAHRWRRR